MQFYQQNYKIKKFEQLLLQYATLVATELESHLFLVSRIESFSLIFVSSSFWKILYIASL